MPTPKNIPEDDANEGTNLNKETNRSNWNDNSRIDWNDNGANWGNKEQDADANAGRLEERGKDRRTYDNGSNVDND